MKVDDAVAHPPFPPSRSSFPQSFPPFPPPLPAFPSPPLASTSLSPSSSPFLLSLLSLLSLLPPCQSKCDLFISGQWRTETVDSAFSCVESDFYRNPTDVQFCEHWDWSPVARLSVMPQSGVTGHTDVFLIPCCLPWVHRCLHGQRTSRETVVNRSLSFDWNIYTTTNVHRHWSWDWRKPWHSSQCPSTWADQSSC